MVPFTESGQFIMRFDFRGGSKVGDINFGEFRLKFFVFP